MKILSTKYMKFYLKNIKLFFLFSLIVIFASAYNINCRIDFNIKGLENQSILFAYEYGNKQIVLDSIKLDVEGKGFYSSKNRLTGGIYNIVFPNKKYFQLLINDEQFFTFISDTSGTLKKMLIEGSEESDLFLQYQILASNYKNKSNYGNIEENRKDTLNIKTSINPNFVEIKKKLDDFSSKIISEKPKSFLAVYFKMQKDPAPPEKLIYDNPEMSREYFLKRYKYTKSHYFDNMPFADVRILRTYLIYEKLEYYFNRLIVQNADSMISAINLVTNLSKVNEESYHFVLNFLNTNYRNPKNPDQEKAFVYLADNYYLNGNATWTDPRFIKLLKIKVDKIRPTLLGSIAPNIELTTSTGKIVNLHDIKADNLIVYFWSPDCDECRKETSALFGIYNQYESKGLMTIAVYVHADKEMWQTYLKEKKYDWINAYDPLMKSDFSNLYNIKSVPKIILLDKNKTIIAKDMNTSQLELMLKNRIE